MKHPRPEQICKDAILKMLMDSERGWRSGPKCDINTARADIFREVRSWVEMYKLQSKFTLDAARQSGEWFHAEMKDGQRFIIYDYGDDLHYHDGEILNYNHFDIVKIAPMYWPQDADWVPVVTPPAQSPKT